MMCRMLPGHTHMDPSTDSVQHWVPTMTACSPHSGLTNAPSSSPSWLVLKPDESADDGTFFFFFLTASASSDLENFLWRLEFKFFKPGIQGSRDKQTVAL